MIDVTVDDGKYRIVQDNGRMTITRSGEPWIGHSGEGIPMDKMIIAMACEIEELRKLKAHCKAFVKDQQIWGSECVYQSDRVIENAYQFIDGVCEIVGFETIPEED